MSSSFENFDFFSKKDDLRISANQKYTAKLNNGGKIIVYLPKRNSKNTEM